MLRTLIIVAHWLPIAASLPNANASEANPPIPQYRLTRHLSPPTVDVEFRGVWITTYLNLDWPSARGLAVKQQHIELRNLFNRAADLQLNAAVFQVRPAGDAFYLSATEPWSAYLTGTQGKAPDPLYDPLEWAVAFAHKRGMELHAWFNPFRLFTDAPGDVLHDRHIAKRQPELAVRYGKHLWLDPGLDEARDYALAQILDVVQRYDIDGVHIDDYFYPDAYKNQGRPVPFPDHGSYHQYRDGGGDLAIADWRRNNINEFVRQLYEGVKRAKPWVRVGISPRGIWRPDYPAGIRGADAYHDLFADSRLWLRQGWLDYFSPQLYWTIADPYHSYAVLMNWWEEQNLQGRHLWPGLASWKALSPWTPEEILNQVRRTRLRQTVTGNLHFRMQFLMDDRPGALGPELKRHLYREPALTPAMTWLDEDSPAPPDIQVAVSKKKTAIRISWTPGDRQDIVRWLVQSRFDGRWVAKIVESKTQSSVLVLDGKTQLPDAIAISAIDRYGNASPPTVLHDTR